MGFGSLVQLFQKCGSMLNPAPKRWTAGDSDEVGFHEAGVSVQVGASPCEPNLQTGQLPSLLPLVMIKMFFPFHLQCLSHPHSKSSSFPSRTVCLGKLN